MTHAAEVQFVLHGRDFDPAEITRMAGLPPTAVFRTPSPMTPRIKWIISSGLVEKEFVDIYAMVSALVAKLRPHIAGIAEAKREHGLQAVLEVILWISSNDSISMPAMGMEAEDLGFLNALGASVDVDIYRRS